MTSPYVLNRFFETTLIAAPAPAAEGLARLLGSAMAASELRAQPAVQRLAAHAIDLARMHTRDIGPQAGERYRWEWSAAVEQPGTHSVPGAFWSVLRGDEPAGVTFLDPRLPMIAVEEPSLRFRDSEGAAPWQHEDEASLGADELLMFPAWLPHVVTRPTLRIDLWPLLPAERA